MNILCRVQNNPNLTIAFKFLEMEIDLYVGEIPHSGGGVFTVIICFQPSRHVDVLFYFFSLLFMYTLHGFR